MSGFNNITLDWITILKKFIQSWILLNGIVPFSAKIIVMTNRNIQSYLKSDHRVDYQIPSSMDNFYTIPNIICDKTGTLTKNELLLTHISNLDTIYNESECDLLPFDLLYSIIIGLHCKNSTYDTEEDRIISEKLISMGAIVEFHGNNIKITKDSNQITAHIIVKDQLQFDCTRKLSSVIFYINSPDNTFIVTKGPISKIETLLNSSELNTFATVSNKYSTSYPYLRTMAFAIRSISYDSSIDPCNYEISNKYLFISILGIQDEIQPKITDTIRTIS